MNSVPPLPSPTPPPPTIFNICIIHQCGPQASPERITPSYGLKLASCDMCNKKAVFVSSPCSSSSCYCKWQIQTISQTVTLCGWKKTLDSLDANTGKAMKYVGEYEDTAGNPQHGSCVATVIEPQAVNIRYIKLSCHLFSSADIPVVAKKYGNE